MSQPIKQQPGQGGMLSGSAGNYTGAPFGTSQPQGQVSPVRGGQYSTLPTGIQNPEDQRGQYAPTHQPPQGGGIGFSLSPRAPGSMLSNSAPGSYTGTYGPQTGGPMPPPGGPQYPPMLPNGRPDFESMRKNMGPAPGMGDRGPYGGMGPNPAAFGQQPPQMGGYPPPYQPSGRVQPGSPYQPPQQQPRPGYYQGGY